MLSKRGFTLIEVLVVLAITSLLAGMILTYTSSSRDQVALYVEEAKMAQTLSRAKALSITTFNRPEVPCGYGVHMDYDAGTYSLFSYPAAACDGLSSLDYAKATPEETFTLPMNVKLKEDAIDAAANVLFVPPDPKTWIWKVGDTVTSTQASVVLTTPKGMTATIKMNKSGQITF